ncbi:MAG: two pore domain potassium channel family protein [Gammaproteobacteria bacterium]|nr:MAG: two pore domain potassium channel family protein [Gammaproteobacteria bacterium]
MPSTNELTVVAAALLIVILCVTFHYEGLRLLSGWLAGKPFNERLRVAGLILALLALHVIEILLFALGYGLMLGVERFGSLLHFGYGDLLVEQPMQLFDYVYYSATVYTTLGFGDIVPSGPIRALTGSESLCGLVLITWSASFTFLEMQRHWGRG